MGHLRRRPAAQAHEGPRHPRGTVRLADPGDAMNPIKFRPQATLEYEDRKAGEHAKAVAKYGQEAADAPSGNPAFDVMDFAINELVGLDRYGEMIAARARECLDLMEELPRGTRVVLRDAIVLGEEIRRDGRQL